MSKYLPAYRQGDTWRIGIRYLDGSDLTGWKFWLTLKDDPAKTDAQAILQATKTAAVPGETGDDAAHGLVWLTVAKTLTAAVTPGKYYWDLQILSDTGDLLTLLPPAAEATTDKFVVTPQITLGAS